MHCLAWIKSYVPEEPDSDVMVTWPSLNVPDNQSVLHCPTRSLGKVDESIPHCGLASLSGKLQLFPEEPIVTQHTAATANFLCLTPGRDCRRLLGEHATADGGYVGIKI
jgi:hypothetical protein